jgi:uncharacterized protein YbjT (DUF2867 family)
MKITVTGSLGNISKPLTKELVQKGHEVTVISSKPERQKDIEALGATAAIGTLEDFDFVLSSFTGADAVYTMVPPHDFFDDKFDLMNHYRIIGNNYMEAIQESGIKRVVHLSSVGAHLEKGTGLVLAHHYLEGLLDNLKNIAITIMRPTAFYYNLYSFITGIKTMGTIMSNYGADDELVWVSPVDIATAIAEEMETPLVGRKLRYVASEELTCNEVAGILGAAIGKADLKWTTIPNEQMEKGLIGFGMAPKIAAALVEMQACMHSGVFFEDYYQNRPVMGKTKMKDFAKEFAVAYNQK